MKAIEWLGDRVRFLDQTELPLREIFIETDDYRIIADAIRHLKIRGAPLIGIAAAYGVALSALRATASDRSLFQNDILHAIAHLSSTRPTAVNLYWALSRMEQVLVASRSYEEARRALIEEACTIHREDEETCRKIGEHGASLVPDPATILTHCNTGFLATGGSGTAQSVITTAHDQGKRIRVYADETRPLLQGARLTTWELMKHGIDVTLNTDSMAGFLMQRRKIDLVIVGADRIAANGDTANKIGTYSIAVLARSHGIPFYVAAPTSTIDVSLSSGDAIPIEERAGTEVVRIADRHIAPEGVKVYSPAFDITPAQFITAIITEHGVHYPPFDFRSALSAVVKGRQAASIRSNHVSSSTGKHS